MMHDTICAIATPLMQGAISIIRLSGDDAITIVNEIFTKDLSKVASHTIHYGYIHENHKKIDEVLVSVFLPPKTFTKECVVEINCHGGVYVTKKILTLLLSKGARMANPGEFTQRAMMNGRIDMAQAEAIQDLIQSNSDHELTLAMQGLKGSVKAIIDPFLDSLLTMIATIEVNIDYPEYDDVEQITLSHLKPEIQKWLSDIELILKNAKSGQIVKDGIKTAIIGRPNVGKSSLLNALLEEDKAIVSDIEGTTRDIVEGCIRLNNITLHLLDTAGIRESDDVVEQIGIQKSKSMIDKSDFVIIVLDSSKPLTKIDEELLALTANKQRLVVYNKKDIAIQNYPIMISAKDNDIQILIDAIEEMFAQHQFVLHHESLTNERHISQVLKAKQAMQQALFAVENEFEVDLVTIDLQNAYKYLKEIFAVVGKDDLLDTLFSKFCLGK